MGNANSAQTGLITAAVVYHAYRSRGQYGFQTVLHLFTSSLTDPSFFNILAGDILGLLVLFRVLRFVRSLRGLSVSEMRSALGNAVFRLLQKVPGASAKIQGEFDKQMGAIEKSLKPQDREQIFTLPEEGLADEELLSKMTVLRDREVAKWQDGLVSGAVYHGEEKHLQVLDKAYSLFNVTNPLHADIWPSIMKFEAEVISMTASFVDGGTKDVCGTMTSGGTESIIMSVKAHRAWMRSAKGITEPELIAPDTAHAAFDKACDMMCIKHIKVPVDPVTHKVDIRAVKRAITSNTIMLVGSAPQFPHGIIDPIEELSQLAVKHHIGLHVDCCLGGFVLPFARQLGYDIPKFDFGLPGVTAMSLDTHKYGYASKGTSIVLYRNPEVRKHQYFVYVNWPGGIYATPSTAGSRPGGLIAACWASMVRLGLKGYQDQTRKIMETTQLIRKGIDKIPGVYVLGDPKAMVVAFGSKEFNIYNIGDKMSHRGWSLNALQRPACLHICVTVPHTKYYERFLKELAEAVEEVRAAGGKVATDGAAPLYGATSSLPNGPIEDMVCSYMDIVLKV